MPRRWLIGLCALILGFIPANACRAQPFPSPAYQFALANATPDAQAIRRVFAKYSAPDARLETHSYHNGKTNRLDMVWDAARYRADVLCLTGKLYGVEGGDAVARARAVAEAFMDELGISYMPEPLLAKTARTFATNAPVWLDAVDGAGRVLWMNPLISKTVWPEDALLCSSQYQAVQKLDSRDLQAFPSPEDVVLRYQPRLDTLALDARTCKEPENGTWQLILITVAADGTLLSVQLQNASFQIKGQKALAPPLLDCASAAAIAQASADTVSHLPEKTRYDQWLALGGYESIGQGWRLQDAQPCYARLGRDRAVPAWKCTFLPAYIVEGETRVLEGGNFFLEIFVDAIEGRILPL
ncbi:MAG: hypothetical protein MR842_01070 [Clostridiales bacterium]|nr:hypothetical protein [Clostridiales bacterium]MDO4349800.1 hypothetical protein [Eubacteriales bacterium]MDY4007418.1 hypothetical protein [Candidatus Limiplasma sp.]